MKAKLVAFVILVGLLAGLPFFLIDRSRRRIPGMAVAQLMPDIIGAFRVTERWKNVSSGEEVEMGAAYQDRAGNAPVLLDVKTGSRHEHDSIGCFLVRAAAVWSFGVQNLKTADSPGLFELALIEDDSGSNPRTLLVGATECWADGCGARPARRRGWFWRGSLTDWAKARRVPVPVSIVVEQAGGVPRPDEQTRLLERFRQFVASLQLGPMRALSAAQSD